MGSVLVLVWHPFGSQNRSLGVRGMVSGSERAMNSSGCSRPLDVLPFVLAVFLAVVRVAVLAVGQHCCSSCKRAQKPL